MFDAVEVDVGAIVGDFEMKISAFVEGANAQGAFFRFAFLQADFGRFQTVIHGVVKNVGDRVLDGFEKRFIEFGIATLSFEFDFFCQGPWRRREREVR